MPEPLEGEVLSADQAAIERTANRFWHIIKDEQPEFLPPYSPMDAALMALIAERHKILISNGIEDATDPDGRAE